MTTSIKEKTQDQLNEWKEGLEKLKLQLQMSAAETKDTFESEKLKLKEWVEASKKKMTNLKDNSEASLEKLKSSLEELKVQAALGKAETKDELIAQQINISQIINNLKEYTSELLETSDNKMNDFVKSLDNQLNFMQMQFDLFLFQLRLEQSDAMDLWTDKKKMLLDNFESFKKKVEKGSETASEKWDGFTSEMAESWKHLKKAFMDS